MSALDGTKANMQLVTIGMLIAMAVVIVGLNIFVQGFDDDFVQGTIVPAAWTVLILAMGAAFAQLGLGRQNNPNPNTAG